MYHLQILFESINNGTIIPFSFISTVKEKKNPLNLNITHRWVIAWKLCSCPRRKIIYWISRRSIWYLCYTIRFYIIFWCFFFFKKQILSNWWKKHQLIRVCYVFFAVVRALISYTRSPISIRSAPFDITHVGHLRAATKVSTA